MKRVSITLVLCLIGCSSESSPNDSAVDLGLDAPLSDLAPPPDIMPPCVHPKVVKQCTGGLCRVSAGCYVMGSPADEPCRSRDEAQIQVTLSHDFEMAATEVTQKQFESNMGYNPAYFLSCGGLCPVEQVSWHEAAAYCNAVSTRLGLETCYLCGGSADGGVAPEGQVRCKVQHAFEGTDGRRSVYGCGGFRLPTEAEWEYAYRAGTKSALYVGPLSRCTGERDPNADRVGWYKENSNKRYWPTGKLEPNGWGIHDMAGNVWEWCHDRLDRRRGTHWLNDPVGDQGRSDRAIRGGSWRYYARSMRAAGRLTEAPSSSSITIGFRCVRTVLP